MSGQVDTERALLAEITGNETDTSPGIILAVDDLPDNLSLLEAILTPKGFQVVKANSGSEALALIEMVLPDVIFLDVMMPGMDGFEVTRRIRAMLTLPYIPIVLVTALQDSKSKLIGLEAGADEFLSKPFSQPELLARARALIRLRRSNQALTHSVEENRHLNDLLSAENIRLAQELNRTREAQLRLMPQQGPDYPGVSFAAHYQPALEVGGDYYDYVRLDEHRFVIVLGDAVGKGGAAVLSVAIIKSVLATEFARMTVGINLTFDPAEILTRLNAIICGPLQSSRTEMTLFCGVVDLAAHTISFSNAGQTFPYLSRAGTLLELKLSGLPIGLFDDAVYSKLEVPYQAADRLILYSDGINECMNIKFEEFGLPRLEAAIHESAGHAPDRMLKHILDRLNQFSEDGVDDQTLVIFGF